MKNPQPFSLAGGPPPARFIYYTNLGMNMAKKSGESKPVKWGHLSEIDMRTAVGSDAWKDKHPVRIQKLSAYRRLHQLTNHEDARQYADASVGQMLKAIDKLEEQK